MDGWRLITTSDPAERLTLMAVAMEAAKAKAEFAGANPLAHLLGLGGGE